MARDLIPATKAVSNGALLVGELTPVVVNGAYMQNNGGVLHVRNAGATSHTVTIKVYRTVDGLAVVDRTQAIAAGAEYVFGPFDLNDYGSQVLVDIDHTELRLRVVE